MRVKRKSFDFTEKGAIIDFLKFRGVKITGFKV